MSALSIFIAMLVGAQDLLQSLRGSKADSEEGGQTRFWPRGLHRPTAPPSPSEEDCCELGFAVTLYGPVTFDTSS